MRLIDVDALIKILDTTSAFPIPAWLRAVIIDMPTIEPERKKGQWKFYGKETWVMDDGKPVFIQCSECNATVMNNASAVWNFCPDCGADMRGEQDESD